MATKTKQEMDQMSARDQVWEALNTSYGQSIDKSNASYDSAIAQQDRSMIGRGMQRSSYGQQVLANMQNQKVKAANDLEAQKNAEYMNRLYQIGRDEVADNQWERQFGENQRQFNENMAYNRDRAAVSDNQWERQFATSNEQWEKSFNAQNDQWKQQFEYTKMSDDQKLAYNYVTAIIGQGGTPSDDLLARAGLSRADANSMTAQVASGGGGGGRRGDGGGGDGDTTGVGDSWADSLFATNASNTISSAAQIVANATKPYTPYGEWKTNQEKKKNG